MALLQAVDGWLILILIVSIESDCMTKEIDGIIFELEFLEHVSHWLLLDVNILPGLWVVEVQVLAVEVEASASLLFEETHER